MSWFADWLGRKQTNVFRTLGLVAGQAAVVLFSAGLLGQELDLIQNVEVLGGMGIGQAANLQLANSKPVLLKQMRGLIQNELTIVNGICNLEQKQKQTLVDLAEGDWKAKTNTTIIKRTQEHVYGTIDLDSLAERSVRTWLESVANPEQLGKYDEELADRMRWRQKALISKILDILGEKLNLSGVQLTQIEEILNEKWKDRWYRSLEATFENTSMLPEIRPSWITPILSESQKAALVTRDQQMVFGGQRLSTDLPAVALEKPFHVGDATSADEVDLVPLLGNKSPADERPDKAKAEENERTTDAKKP